MWDTQADTLMYCTLSIASITTAAVSRCPPSLTNNVERISDVLMRSMTSLHWLQEERQLYQAIIPRGPNKLVISVCVCACARACVHSGWLDKPLVMTYDKCWRNKYRLCWSLISLSLICMMISEFGKLPASRWERWMRIWSTPRILSQIFWEECL